MAIEKSKNTYLWPIPAEAVIEHVREENNLSHVGTLRGAIDIAVPIGTLVLAAQSGKITVVKDDSAEYGIDPSYTGKANYVEIQHQNGEFSQYVHLDKGSVMVSVGQAVEAGEAIAKVGLSGWTTAPHLHLNVVRLDAKTKVQCVYPGFANPPDNYDELVVGERYS